MDKIKAIALVSGGLDSILAAKLVKDLGIELIIFNMKTPFCLCDRKETKGCVSESVKLASVLNAKIKIIYVTDEYFEIIKNPKHGYGSHMNPCIDCRIFLFRKAKELMQESGAAFIVTGEVLGQRPMSQHRKALQLIEKKAELEGLVLRPLSAKILDETLPEKKGWIQREKMLDYNGRSRRPQIGLAKQFNIKDYPCAAGGCLLTDAGFSRRIKDLISYGELKINDVELLKIGRHFRLSATAKLIVGRNEIENEKLLRLAQDSDIILEPKVLAGPSGLGRGKFSENLKNMARSIIARYTDGTKDKIDVITKVKNLSEDTVCIKAIDDKALKTLLI